MEKKKFKVEFAETQNYVIDVLAEDEKQAVELAQKKLEELQETGTLHYHENGDREIVPVETYDVTNTDDLFDAENE